MLRPPGQGHEGIRFRMQKQVALCLVPEPGHGRAVKGDAVLKGPGQLVRHDGDVFLLPKHITESETDKLYVLLPGVLDDLVLCILHDFLLLSQFRICWPTF